ncbi:tol-pal system YbgF family protein [Streptomyces sp. NPDC007808]|uniref:tetratricopeptide repeat protein n=1 Tax=Streptomyces sp. NPDC007808 TaxID=3364779 RepID=UPI00367BC391
MADLVGQALSHRCGRLITAEDTGLVAAPGERRHGTRDSVPPPQEEPDPVRRLVRMCRAQVDPERRVLLTQTVFDLSGASVPPWHTPSYSRGSPVGRPVVRADLAILRAATRLFAAGVDAHGGNHARSALAAYLADDGAGFISGPAPDELHRQALTAVAQLTHLLAVMTVDAGHQGLAQSYFRTSLGLAHAAGDRLMCAIVLRAMSTQAANLGHIRQAADLASAAARHAPPGSPAGIRAYVLSQRALTRALLRDSRRADADLADAEDALRQSSGDGGPFTSYPAAAFAYQRGRALYALGRRDQAVTAFQDAVHARSPRERRPAALTHARLAHLLLEAGRLEEACSHWQHCLDLYPFLRSAQADRALADLIHTLSAFPRHPRAVGLCEQARGLMAPVRKPPHGS